MNEFLDASINRDIGGPLFAEDEEELERSKLLSTDSLGTQPEPLVMPPPPVEGGFNVFQSGMDESEENREAEITRGVMAAASEESVDEIVETKRLAGELGLPVDIVAGDKAGAQQQEKINIADGYLANAPRTRKIMQDFDKAWGLTESVPELAWFEKVSNTFGEWADNLSLGTTKGDLQVEQMKLIREAKKSSDPGTKSNLMRQASEIDKKMAELPTTRSNIFGGAGALESFAKILPLMIEGYKETLPYAVEAAGINALAFTPGGPAAMGLAGVTAFTATMTGGMALFTAETEESFSYKELIDAGMSEENADSISRTVGGVNAVLELSGAAVVLAPFKKPLMKIFKTKLTTVLKDVTRAKAIKTGLKFYAAGAAAEMGTEGLQQVSNIAGINIGQFIEGKEVQVTTEKGREKIIDELLQVLDETGKAMIFLGAPGPAFRVGSDILAVNRAAQTEKLLKSLGEDSPDIAGKLPLEYASAINEITKDGPIENAYIDASELNVVYQDRTVALAGELGVDEETLKDAIETNGLIEVPIGTYAAKIARDVDNYVKIAPHTKFDPVADTPAEASKRKTSPEDLQKIFDDSVVEGGITDEAVASAQQVFDAEKARLEATGRYTADQIEKQAMVRRQIVTTMAGKYNELPHEFVEKRLGGEKLRKIDAINNPLEISREEYNKQGLPPLQPGNDGIRILAGVDREGNKVGETNVSKRELQGEQRDPTEAMGILNQQALAVREAPENQKFFAESSVVDEDGEPIMLFHSTLAPEIKEFRVNAENELGAHFGTSDQANNRIGAKKEGRTILGLGFGSGKPMGENVIPVFLNIKNLLRMPDVGDFSNFGQVLDGLMDSDLTDQQVDEVIALVDDAPSEANEMKIIKDFIEEQGFDGVVYSNENEGYGDSYIAFKQEQIKSIFNQNPTDSSDTLKQSAAPLQKKPLKIKGTGPGGKVTNWDVGEAMTDRHMEEHGRVLDPKNSEEDYKLVLKEMDKEYKNQVKELDAGHDWYIEDINEAVEVTKLIIPALKESYNKDLFLTITALMSPQQRPSPNWELAVGAMEVYLKDGRIPEKRPNGMNFGVNALRTGTQMVQQLIDKHGLDGALEWLVSDKTGREMAQFRMDSGLFEPNRKLSAYLAGETKLSGTYPGIAMMGPKVSEFFANVTGFDQDAVTVDLWAARTYNRAIGRLLDVSPQKVQDKEIVADVRGKGERDLIKRLFRDLAKKNNVDPSAMQAALWYFEQRLFKNHGVSTKSENFSGAAVTAAEARQITVPRRSEDAEGVGQDAGGKLQEGQTEELNQSEIDRVTPSWYYSQLAESFHNLPDNRTQDQSAKGWMQIFKKLNAKPAEKEWTGIFEWLETQTKEQQVSDLEEAVAARELVGDDNLSLVQSSPSFAKNQAEILLELKQSLAEAQAGKGPKITKEQISNWLFNNGVQIEVVEIDNTTGVTQEEYDEKVADIQDRMIDESVRAQLADKINDEIFALSTKDKDGNLVRGEPFDVTRARLEEAEFSGGEIEAGIRILGYGMADIIQRSQEEALEQLGGVGNEETGVNLEPYTFSGGTDKGNILLKFDQGHPDDRIANSVQFKINQFSARVMGSSRNGHIRTFFKRHMILNDEGETVLLPPKYSKWADYINDKDVNTLPGHELAKSIFSPKEEQFFNENMSAIANGESVSMGRHFDSHVFPGHRNIVVWIRKQTREVNGQKVLVIDEVQSDLGSANEEGSTSVRTPFTDSKSSYATLAMKKIITYAVENGFDRVEWTTGSQQSERYPGLKDIADAVRYTPETQKLEIIKPGKNSYTDAGKVDPKSLRGMIGKDATEQLLANPKVDDRFHVLETAGLEISGKGMVDFYDILMPNVASKAIKSLTGEKVEIEPGDPAVDSYDSGRQPGFDVGPIRDAFGEDQVSMALFQKKKANGGKNRASLSFNPFDITIDDTVLKLLENADLTSYLHENGHYYFEVMRHLASQPGAPKAIRDDMNALLRFIGVDKDTKELTLDTWNKMSLSERRAGHEKVAEAWERYLFEGKAPTLELQALFRSIREWFVDMYKNYLQHNVALSDEVRGVFDRLIASDAEIEAAKASRDLEPLFKNNDVIGMTPTSWAAYSSMGKDAQAEAEEKLSKADLRNFRWLQGARGKILAQMQREEKFRREGVREEATKFIGEQPIYKIKQLLQTPIAKKEKRKFTRDVDPQSDSLFTAIAKLGGIDRAEAVLVWGIDPKDKFHSGLGAGKPVIRKEGGSDIDSMGERLAAEGYLPLDEVTGRWDPRDLEDRFEEEHAGNKKFSTQHEDYDISEAYENFIIAEGGKVPLESLVGKGVKLSADLLREEFSGRDPIWEQLPSKGRHAMVVEEGGVAPAAIAEEFGFTSVDEMIQTLVAAPDMREAVQLETDRRMLEIYGDIDTPEQRDIRVAEALSGKIRTKQVHAELTALSGAIGDKNLLRTEAQEFAENKIARIAPGKIRPAQYFAAERRANEDALKALAKGDKKGAANFKKAAVLQFHFGKAATRALEEVERMVKYFKAFDKDTVRKRIAKEQLEQIDGRLELYDLRKSVTNAELESRTNLADWVANQEALGFFPDIDPNVLNTSRLKHYRDVSMEELRGLQEAVRSIDMIGRNLKKAMILDETASINEMVGLMTTRMAESKKKRHVEIETERGFEPTKSNIRSFLALHKKFSFHAKSFDGERDGGPSWKYLVRPLNERTEWATRRKSEATVALSEIYGQYTAAEQRQNNKKIFLPRFKGRTTESLSKNGIVSVALNWGNATNQKRIMSTEVDGGYGWTREDIEGPDGILSHMTLKDWRFVQSIWDYLDTYWDEIAAKEARVNGKQTEKVEALPVNTQFGQFRGGYYPIKYNAKLSSTAAANEISDMYDQLKRGDIGRATTKKGHAENRVKGDVDRPVHLDHILVVMGHVNQVIHDLAFHEYLIDANRILNHGDFQSAVKVRFGSEVYSEIQRTIKDVAQGDIPAATTAEALLHHLRVGASIAAMGWNTSTAAIQFLGLSQSFSRVGTKWVFKGMARFFTGAENMDNGYQWIYEHSAMMRDRAATIMREINEIRNKVSQTGILGGLNSKMGDTYFYFIAKAQMMVDVPTWIGAYTKAMEEGVDGRQIENEAEAIALADQAVKESQSSGEIMDQAGIQRGGPGWKLFTTFYSFFSATYNNNAHAFNKTDFKSAYSVGAYAADFLMINFLPVALSLLIKDVMIRGACDGGSDLECMGKKLVEDEATWLLGTMVLVRELGGALQGFAGYGGPAGVGFFSQASKLVVQAEQGEPDRAMWKALIGTLGTAFHKPAVFLNRILDAYLDAEEGKNVRPLAPLFGQDPDSK